VVTTENGNSRWISDLHGDHERNGLDWVIAAIDVVAHEQEVIIWDVTTDLKEFLEVPELSVDITADGDWSSNLSNIALILEHFFCFLT
jgi:hypothetical protein